MWPEEAGFYWGVINGFGIEVALVTSLRILRVIQHILGIIDLEYRASWAGMVWR